MNPLYNQSHGNEGPPFGVLVANGGRALSIPANNIFISSSTDRPSSSNCPAFHRFSGSYKSNSSVQRTSSNPTYAQNTACACRYVAVPVTRRCVKWCSALQTGQRYSILSGSAFQPQEHVAYFRSTARTREHARAREYKHTRFCRKLRETHRIPAV